MIVIPRYVAYIVIMTAVGFSLHLTTRQLVLYMIAELAVSLILVLGMPTKREIEQYKGNPKG